MYKGRWTGELVIAGKRMVTTSRAAELLGTSEDTIRRSCDEGTIPFIRHPVHGYRLIPMSFVQKNAARSKTG